MNTWTNDIFVCLVLFWIVCGPIGLVWAAMKYYNKGGQAYAKVSVDSDTDFV